MNLIPYSPSLLRWQDDPASPLEHWLSRGSTWMPPVDFVEEKDRYVIIMDAPGLKKSDIQVDYQDGILYLRGNREHEKDVTDDENILITLERRCGEFVRHFHLDRDILSENIRADYKSGVLTVAVPKDTESGGKRLHVKVN